jgi:alanine dehydrogenase
MQTLGIIREGKQPYDLRTPLTPQQCIELRERIPSLRVIVQPSPHRCFRDDEYAKLGIEVNEDMSACNVLLGVKEVPIPQLIAGKTYLFFSHTIKKQSYNRPLLRAIIQNNIRLIDYETLIWDSGNRIIGFGRFAGLVGTHYAFLMWGKKYGLYELKPAIECKTYAAMIEQYAGMKLPPMKIVLCGDGRVAHGAIELLKKLKVHHVSQEEFLENNYTEAVYVHLRSEDYYVRKDGREWDKADFYKHPEDYLSCFQPYYRQADVMINAVFWKDGVAPFFTREEMKGADFRIRIISDISCDIPGPLPSTLRPTIIGDPYYGYDPFLEKEVAPFQHNSIDVQAVNNLPCELPVDASYEFGEQLTRHVLPHLFSTQSNEVIKNATITENGMLTEKYRYLSDYVS